MGCFLGCMKLLGFTPTPALNEWTPLSTQRIEGVSMTSAEEDAKFYQSIIDEAQSKFINIAHRFRSGSEYGIAEMRKRVGEITIDADLLRQEGYSPGLSSNNGKGIRGNSKGVLDVLGENDSSPLRDSMDELCDEIFELVSRNTHNIVQSDNGRSAFVSLQTPMISTTNL